MTESILPQNEQASTKSVFSNVPPRPALRKYDIIFAVLVVLLTLGFCYLVKLTIEGASWWLPLLASIVWLAGIAVFSVSASTKKLVRWTTFAVFIPTLVFAFSFVHVVTVLIAGGLLSHAMVRSRRAMFNARQMRIGPALQLNLGSVVLALSLVVTSQFYSTIAQRPPESLLPELSSVYGVDQTISAFVGGEEMTVDDFLRQQLGATENGDATTESKEDGATMDLADGIAARIFQDAGLDPAALSAYGAESLTAVNSVLDDQKGRMEDAAITSLRTRLSATTGQELSGTETIASVMRATIDAKMRSVLSSNPVIARTIAEVLAIILLLTLVSIGSLWKLTWMWGSQMLFAILRRNKVIRITTVKRDVETLLF